MDSLEMNPHHFLDSERTPREEGIQYSSHLHFRAADGNFEILKLSDRKLTPDDIDNGMYSRQDKLDFSFARLFHGLPLQLSDPGKEMSPEQRTLVDSLKAGRPTFVALDQTKVDEEFAEAAASFSGSLPGAILFPESGIVMNQFSAIAYDDGRIARLLRGGTQEDLSDFLGRLNLLTPNMEAQEISEERTAYAMEFMQNGERPVKINRSEMDDWLERVEESRLVWSFDVGEQDSSLDNFVRVDQKLFWVDGDIREAQLAQSDEELNQFLNRQRSILERYIDA